MAIVLACFAAVTTNDLRPLQRSMKRGRGEWVLGTTWLFPDSTVPAVKRICRNHATGKDRYFVANITKAAWKVHEDALDIWLRDVLGPGPPG